MSKPMFDAGKFIDYVWSLREERDQLAADNKRLELEISRLKLIVADQSVRRFVGHDDQREMDDLVAAGIRASDAEKQRLECEVAKLKAMLDRVQVSLSLDDTEWGYTGAEKYKLLADIKVALSTTANGEQLASASEGE